MKFSISLLLLFMCSFTVVGQKTMHVHYQFIPVAEEETTAQRMQAMVGAFSKDYYKSGDHEMVVLSLDEGEIFRYIATGASSTVMLYAHSGENKMVVDLDDAFFTDMKAMADKRNPAPFSDTKESKNIQGVNCSLSTIEAMDRTLEFWLDKSTSTKLPVSAFMKMNDVDYLPLVIDTVIPQRGGTTSKDKIRIEAESILTEVDKNVFDFGQDTFTPATMDEVQEALGISYMLLFLF
jgi:hypothetical protein